MNILFIQTITIQDIPYYFQEDGSNFDILNNCLPGHFIFLNRKGVLLIEIWDYSFHFIFNIVKGFEALLLSNKKDFCVFGDESDENSGYLLRIEVNEKNVKITKNNEQQISIHLKEFYTELNACSKYCFHIYNYYFSNLKHYSKAKTLEESINQSLQNIKNHLKTQNIF